MRDLNLGLEEPDINWWKGDCKWSDDEEQEKSDAPDPVFLLSRRRVSVDRYPSTRRREAASLDQTHRSDMRPHLISSSSSPPP